MEGNQSTSHSSCHANQSTINPFRSARARYERLFNQATKESLRLDEVDPLYCERLSHLVLIVGSSRSGSSWLAKVLAGSFNFCSLVGEVDPFLILSSPEMNYDTDSSDALNARDVNSYLREKLSLLLSWMVGSHKLRYDYWYLSSHQMYDIALRTILQWPYISLHDSHLLRIITLCFGFLNNKGSPSYAMLNYLRCLRSYHDELINPYYYDMPYSLIHNAFPNERFPSGPPSIYRILEEPPFIPFTPWLSATPEQRVKNPLILKSPSDSYRLDFFRALFPNAKITVVHVVRDPIESITGIMSAWKHHCFFKHRLKYGSLNIEGYSNPSLPWTCEWWKLDLPPGWTKYTDKPLMEVCTFQWLSANNHVLDWVNEHKSEITYVQIQYEVMIKDLKREVLRLCNATNVISDIGLLYSLREDRKIMASAGFSGEVREIMRRKIEDISHNTEVIEIQRLITEFRQKISR